MIIHKTTFNHMLVDFPLQPEEWWPDISTTYICGLLIIFIGRLLTIKIIKAYDDDGNDQDCDIGPTS